MPLFGNNKSSREAERFAAQKRDRDRCKLAIAKLGPVVDALYEDLETKKMWTQDLGDLAKALEDLLARFPKYTLESKGLTGKIINEAGDK